MQDYGALGQTHILNEAGRREQALKPAVDEVLAALAGICHALEIVPRALRLLPRHRGVSRRSGSHEAMAAGNKHAKSRKLKGRFGEDAPKIVAPIYRGAVAACLVHGCPQRMAGRLRSDG